MIARIFKLSVVTLLLSFVSASIEQAEASGEVRKVAQNDKAKTKRKAPSWVGTSVVKTMYSTKDLTFTVRLKHTNNSVDRVITMFYDRSMKVYVMTESNEVATSIAISSNKVTQKRLLPGESVVLDHTVKVDQKRMDWIKRNDTSIRVKDIDMQVKHERL